MGEELQSWKSVFRLGELLELAAARKQAQSHNKLYGNLTFSQSRVCIALIRLLEKQPEGVTLKQLSAELEVTPGAASELVEELVKKGVVSRTRSETNRRAVCIRFLDNVMAMHRTASKEIESTYRKMLSVLSAEELSEWERLLDKILNSYQKGQN